MSTKRPKKTKEKPEPPKVPVAPKQSDEESSGDQDPFDFGGLPKRDLKKNLGCG